MLSANTLVSMYYQDLVHAQMAWHLLRHYSGLVAREGREQMRARFGKAADRHVEYFFEALLREIDVDDDEAYRGLLA